jgi:ATP-binding cassette subfamily F protein 3
MHLLSLVADRLWLVKDGGVAPFEEDLEAYRALLLSANSGPQKTEKKEKPKRASRDTILALKAEVRKCEERVEKLQDMAMKLSGKLADPALYEGDKVGELEVWNRKYAEVSEATERAEALWMAALEKLERAEGSHAA